MASAYRLWAILKPDQCSCQVAAANCGQVVSSLAIFCIFERDAQCDMHGGAVSWYLGGICGFTI
jgi:hypothetical protein